ncbi:hypothetical protein GGR21_000785 [Dysgonomonas hofstadii]|uniref:LysM domain-containing protein n=1 Tax=Dysgonomonas hofstadii TaxID=637886 RepID=A0A840CLH6_9BACT|nr:LysM domain-containing protein [Dysgonomonas hofstadii]MBB4034898.1 hypothetical protein [Dysgonomonas hofstadii]
METKVIAKQSLFDIAILAGGSIESVFDIALQNDLSITGEMSAGQTIDISGIEGNQITDYYRVKGIMPTTFSSQEIFTLSGLGYMALEENFIVS